MKRFLLNIILIVVAMVLIYQYRDVLAARLLPVWNNAKLYLFSKAPCEEPIAYVLNTFDKEFNISKTYFLSALSDAEAIWEKSAGVELFTYEPTSSASNTLKINLIYDYRQQATSKLASLGIVVKDNRASYDMLRTKLDILKKKFDLAKIDYDARVESFNKRQKVYEEQVRYWNKRGGAPAEEYEKLEDERVALDREVSKLQALQKNINEMVEEINSMVVVLNRLAATLNLVVEKYNTIGASRGESFEEGVYIEEGLSRQIDIYEFSNRDKLVRVLAHELGHALGLGHVEDPKAVMYSFNQGNEQTLTASDIEELKLKCDII
ncbi:MAG: matrixin family metalloprotease [Minisyncoccia bacterium]